MQYMHCVMFPPWFFIWCYSDIFRIYILILTQTYLRRLTCPRKCLVFYYHTYHVLSNQDLPNEKFAITPIPVCYSSVTYIFIFRDWLLFSGSRVVIFRVQGCYFQGQGCYFQGQGCYFQVLLFIEKDFQSVVRLFEIKVFE